MILAVSASKSFQTTLTLHAHGCFCRCAFVRLKPWSFAKHDHLNSTKNTPVSWRSLRLLFRCGRRLKMKPSLLRWRQWAAAWSNARMLRWKTRRRTNPFFFPRIRYWYSWTSSKGPALRLGTSRLMSGLCVFCLLPPWFAGIRPLRWSCQASVEATRCFSIFLRAISGWVRKVKKWKGKRKLSTFLCLCVEKILGYRLAYTVAAAQGWSVVLDQRDDGEVTQRCEATEGREVKPATKWSKLNHLFLAGFSHKIELLNSFAVNQAGKMVAKARTALLIHDLLWFNDWCNKIFSKQRFGSNVLVTVWLGN